MTLRRASTSVLGPGRVPLVDVAPERVLEAVGAVEDAGDQTARDLVERVEEHRLALAVHVEALLDELVVVDDVLVEGPGIFGQAERGERALLLGEVDRVHRRVADRHRRVLGIDVDRRDVQPELGLGARSRNLHRPLHLHAGRDAETGRGIQSVYTSFRSSYFAPPILRTARSLLLDRHRERQLEVARVRLSSGFCGPIRSARMVSPSRVT